MKDKKEANEVSEKREEVNQGDDETVGTVQRHWTVASVNFTSKSGELEDKADQVWKSVGVLESQTDWATDSAENVEESAWTLCMDKLTFINKYDHYYSQS